MTTRRRFLQGTSLASLIGAPAWLRAQSAPIPLRFSSSMLADDNAAHYVWEQHFAQNLQASAPDRFAGLIKSGGVTRADYDNARFLLMADKQYSGAIREYSAVIATNPLDKAGAEYNLAAAYMAAGQRDKAQETVLIALEAAPDYRPAQKLLLELQAH